MKISNKITLLIVFLLCVLALNSYIGIEQIHRIGRELKEVVNKNIALTEVITSISQHQLEKKVLLERMLRISEEMSYEDIPIARKKHLIDHSRFVKNGFDELSQKGALKIIEGKKLAHDRFNTLNQRSKKSVQDKTEKYLKEIERSHIKYDNLVGRIFDSIQTSEFQLSFEDLKEVRNVESSLSSELLDLLDQVQGFTRESLLNARKYEEISREILRNSLLISVIFSSLLAFLIIKGISNPLASLEKATKQVGEGNFDVNIKIASRDEIGNVSNAFNVMAEKLLDYKMDIENKNRQLVENLKITESQKKDLEKVNKELDRFAHTVSHDLRAPLTGIIGYASYLMKNFKTVIDEKGRGCLEGIERGAHRMNSLINDLLALTKISRVRNPYEEVSLKEIIEPILDRLEFTIKELKVDLKLPDDMPVVQCDRIKLGEVFLNLINNAIKFSSKNNTENPKIEIGYKDKGDFHEIFVKDNGIGIAPEHNEEIFEVFKRLHGYSEYEGTGAGLSIVKNVIEDHNGKVWVESEPGKGAAFYFTIAKKL